MTLFHNRHGYTLNRCDCGKATLPHRPECVVCAFNKKGDKGEHADKD